MPVGHPVKSASRLFHIPQPTKWNWDKLSEPAVRDRLGAARAVREELKALVKNLERDWPATGMARVGEIQGIIVRRSKSYADLTKLYAVREKLDDAIEYIETRLAQSGESRR